MGCSGNDSTNASEGNSGDGTAITSAEDSGGSATPNTIARQASEPSVAREASEPAPESAPIIHVLGSVRSIADPTLTPDLGVPLIDDDVATVATVSCPPSECPADIVDLWTAGHIEVLNIASREAASEGGGQLGAYVEDLRQLGVTTLGFGNDIDAAVEPVIVRRGGKRVAIHAISLDPDNPAIATSSTPGVAGVTALDALREKIIANRNIGLGVVVLVDWGNSDQRSPSVGQIANVEQLVEAGADAIVGHGSNFLQRFDVIGQTAVSYGLGNASITTIEPLRADTAVLRLEFDTPRQSCLLPATAGPSGPALDDPSIASCTSS